jgi:polyhydroxyalkanoate synthesis regulator phasin
MAQRSGGSQRTSGGSSSRSTSTEARREAARKGGQARGRQQQARKVARETAETATKPVEAAGVSGKTVAEVRSALRENLFNPLNLVLLTRDRIEEVVDEAVSRGRITANDAQEMVQSLLSRGRKQTNDVLNNLESLLERGRSGIETVAVEARDRSTSAAAGARRMAGVGPSFPITDYDRLTAAQVRQRLGTLNAAELRKVRDHERRHANRKTVLAAIESKLD